MQDNGTLMRVNYYLKFLIIIGFILLAIFSVIYKYNDCAKCNFEINGSKFDANNFLNIYAHECLHIGKQDLNIKDKNFTLEIPL